jgi:hypothetical protein
MTNLSLPPTDKRPRVVRQNRRLVQIHLRRQRRHQHRDLGHVGGLHEVILRLVAGAGLGDAGAGDERRQRRARMDDRGDDVVLAPVYGELAPLLARPKLFVCRR